MKKKINQKKKKIKLDEIKFYSIWRIVRIAAAAVGGGGGGGGIIVGTAYN